MILEKKTIKELAKHLSRYSFYIEEINELEVELINSSESDVNSSIRSKNKVSRTTENVALLLAGDTRLNRLKTIIRAIDDLRIELLNEPILLKILNYKYLNQSIRVSDLYVMQRITNEGYPLPNNAYYVLKEKILYKFQLILNRCGIKI